MALRISSRCASTALRPVATISGMCRVSQMPTGLLKGTGSR